MSAVTQVAGSGLPKAADTRNGAGLERLVIDWEDNGSRLLLRPFLEAGLLAMKKGIKKW